MIEHVKSILTGQFEAALSMMKDCLERCPPEHWDGKVAKYSLWHVAYHTLCFTDLYLSPDEGSFVLRDIHPRGWSELNEEFPSRRFDKSELLEYVFVCRRKAAEALAAETRESLEGPSGFHRLPFSRGELHLYNLRHVQHHEGQLSAYLRRVDETLQNQEVLRWARTGWR